MLTAQFRDANVQKKWQAAREKTKELKIKL